jgi:hypothetical protein
MTISEIGTLWEIPESTVEALRVIGKGGVTAIAVNPHSGIGKTLLIEALLNDMPAHRHPIHLRGVSERFEWLREPDLERDESVLIANEISNHMKIYLWGEAAAAAIGLARDGWTMWGTAHASAARDLFADWIRGGLITSLSGLPDRLVVIAIDAVDTSFRRTVSFELVERGASTNVASDELIAVLRQTGA